MFMEIKNCKIATNLVEMFQKKKHCKAEMIFCNIEHFYGCEGCESYTIGGNNV